MRFKKLILVTFLLLAILTIGAVSASEDIADASQDDMLAVEYAQEDLAENPNGEIIADDDAYDALSYDASDFNLKINESMNLADDKSAEVDASGNGVLKAAINEDNLGVTGSDFKFEVRKKEVDNASKSTVMFRFEWPDELMWGPNRMSIVITSNKNVNVVSFYQDQTDGTVDIKLKDLGIWGPGTYNYSATFYDLFDNPGVFVSSGSFIVTSNDVPVDFINITEKVINDTEEVVLTIYDPLGNLTGLLYVYANDTLVFEKDFRIGNGGKGYDNLTVYAKDLDKNKIFDGANNIKVIYKKLDGKKYTKEAVIHFVNIFGTVVPTYMSFSGKTFVYNQKKLFYVCLTDKNDTPIAGKIIHIKGSGLDLALRTNSNGEISYPFSKLVPGKYIVSVEFEGDQIYKKSSNAVRITVKKATPKITAKSETFKKSVKTKKYSVTLKTDQNKVMKNAKLTIKVNKKTYTAKTNSKGVATFKITNLAKKGKYAAIVKYAESNCYNTKSVNVKITVK